MAKFSVDGEDDDDAPSSSGLGRRRRFPSSGHPSEFEEGSRSRSRRRPDKEEEGGREEEEDGDSDIDRRDESDPSEEESEEPDRGRPVHAEWYGDEYSCGRSWSPPYGRTAGSLEVTLTDPDVFDCAVCLEPLTSPVFQCDNGHIACSSCCKKISNKCPSCTMPIGYNRCRAMEKVLESVQMACRNAKFGCNLKFGYHMKSDHEKTCPFTPCSCPFSSCNYIGSFRMLVKHFSTKHGASPTSFCFNFCTSLLINVEKEVCLLKEEREDVLFVLKNETVDLGSKIKISCIGPLPKAAYSYNIAANSRESSLHLHTCTKSTADFDCNPNLEPYLLVPRMFFDDFLGLKVEVWAREAYANRRVWVQVLPRDGALQLGSSEVVVPEKFKKSIKSLYPQLFKAFSKEGASLMGLSQELSLDETLPRCDPPPAPVKVKKGLVIKVVGMVKTFFGSK